MSMVQFRALLAAVVLGIGAALGAAVPAAAGTAPGNEGPAGRSAPMPNGQVAAPPAVTSPGISAGCVGAPHGPNFYAPGSGKTVALTFDDGPGPSTAGIISVLRTYGVPATFFNIGENAAARPALVRAEASMGYLVGNHTWNHPNMPPLSASAQAAQMDEATAEQEDLIGYGPCAFRPPYGDYNSTTLALAQRRGMKVWLWSVDTEDWEADGSSSSYWVNRIIHLAEQEGGALRNPVVLMHNAPSGDPATVQALPTIIKFFRNHGYKFVNLQGSTGTGYQVLTSNGSVRSFGAQGYGSGAGTLGAGVRAVALAADPDTGGYWILKSNGGVNAYHAPWRGSLGNAVPRGQRVTAIAASYGGYLVLTSNGSVRSFNAPWHGSASGSLGRGVTAVGLAADPATGGYWILKSNGGVGAYDAPWHGSLAGKLLRGESVIGIAAAPGGYLVLTSNGGVHNFGAAWHGSAAGTIGHGVTATALAVAPATGGYWIVKSNGGVSNYHAPWRGSLAGKLTRGDAVTGITGM
jgi:peptidoglycan/xylan/chitin deacetylase (PgdA/CDA1 family)